MESKKPCLVGLRPGDLFNIGDPIMVYLGAFHNVIVDAEWNSAKVVNGYRYHEGLVSYRTDFLVFTGENPYNGGFGIRRPEGLLKEDFEYLRKVARENKKFLEIWLKNISKKLKKFNLEKFTSHLVNGRVYRP